MDGRYLLQLAQAAAQLETRPALWEFQSLKSRRSTHFTFYGTVKRRIAGR